jgi:hypothetical protein
MDIVTTIQNTNTLIDFGTQANEAAARAVFALYQERRPINTQRSQRGALRLFTEFVQSSASLSGIFLLETLSLYNLDALLVLWLQNSTHHLRRM